MSKQGIMFQHVENWKQSGLSQGDYSKKNNINKGALSYWSIKYHNQQKVSNQSNFIKVVKQASLSCGNYEIVYPNGVTLRINTSNLSELSTLLKLI